MSGHGAWKNVSRNAGSSFLSQGVVYKRRIEQKRRAGVLGSESFEWLHTARGEVLELSLLKSLLVGMGIWREVGNFMGFTIVLNPTPLLTPGVRDLTPALCQ